MPGVVFRQNGFASALFTERKNEEIKIRVTSVAMTKFQINVETVELVCRNGQDVDASNIIATTLQQR